MEGWVLVSFIVLLGLLFDYTNGVHDAANVVSTVIATKALPPVIAILLTAFFNAVGAFQISGVAHTISTGLLDGSFVTQKMVLCALFGAIGWNGMTWYFGLPSSSSYALVGGLLGSAFSHGGLEIILWKGLIVKVLIPMVVTPFLGFGIAYLVMKGLYRLLNGGGEGYFSKLFRYLQIGSGSLMALSHGLNDAQKSMGVITLGLFASGYIESTEIPIWVIIACALMMGAGTATGGLRIIRFVGFKITSLSSPQGFAAEMSASFVILLASFLGMPISSSQMIVGSVSGVGSAKGMAHVKWELGKKVLLTWIFTLPGSALLSALAAWLSTWFY